MIRSIQPASIEDLEHLGDPETSYELVRGEVVQMTPGGLDHGRPSASIVFTLESWARASKLGRTFTNEVGIITERDPDSVRGADIAYYSYERLPRGNERRGFSAIAPNVVVEILGRGQSWAMLLDKGAEYLRMGVDRVWLVDADRKTILVLSPNEPPAQFGPNDVIRDALILPGFEALVADLFED